MCFYFKQRKKKPETKMILYFELFAGRHVCCCNVHLAKVERNPTQLTQYGRVLAFYRYPSI